MTGARQADETTGTTHGGGGGGDGGDSRARGGDRLVAAALGLLAAGCLLFATRYGAGASPDSISYLGMSKNYAAGNGMYRPGGSAHFPPLYPLMLSGVTGGRITVEGVRWMNAGFLVAGVVLAAAIVWRQGGGRWAAAGAGAIVGLAAPMLSVYAMVWSEVPFLFFLLLALWGLAVYTGDGTWKGLVTAGAAVALATLTRYAGLALVGGGVVAVLLFAPRPRSWIKRARDGALFAAVAGLPIAAFMAWDQLRTGRATDRRWGFYTLTGEDRETVSELLALWFKPSGEWTAWWGITAGCVVAAGVWMWKRRSRPTVEGAATIDGRTPEVRVPWFILPIVLAYVALVLLNVMFVDAQTPLDNRLFCPVYVALAMWVVCVGSKLWARAAVAGGWRAPLRAGVAVAGLLAVVPTVDAGVRWAVRTRQTGIGYSSEAWMRNAMMERVRAFPEGAVLYANVPDAVRLVTGRDCWMIPPRTLAASNKPNPRFANDVGVMWENVRKSGGAVLFFHGAPRARRRHQAGMSEVAAGVSVRVVFDGKEGRVYVLSPDAPPAPPAPPATTAPASRPTTKPATAPARKRGG